MKPIATSLGLATAILLLSGVAFDISANEKSGKHELAAVSVQSRAGQGENEVFAFLGDELIGNCHQSGDGCRKAWEALGRVSASTNP